MRIAMVSEHADPRRAVGTAEAGGQNVHVAALSRALAARGHTVEVYTRRADPREPASTRLFPGVTVELLPAGPPEEIPRDELLLYMGEFGDHIAERLDATRPDVVHAHFWTSGLAALRAGGRCDVPVVQTYHALGVVKRRHQGAADTSPPERIEAERLLGQQVEGVVATCGDEAFELVRLGLERDRISVVPCGVDLEHFTPWGPVADRGDRPRLLSVGRLVERKGIEYVIAALAALPDTELLVAGGPERGRTAADPDCRRLRAAAEEAGVADRVRLLGSVARDRLPALMRSADAVVCAPWYEPFGIVPLEAMACGVPVVAAAVGGLRDSVVDGETGVLVPPRDAGALATAIRGLLGGPDRAARMGVAGRARAERLYAWDRVARDSSAAYRAAVSRRRAAAGPRLPRTSGTSGASGASGTGTSGIGASGIGASGTGTSGLGGSFSGADGKAVRS